MVELKYTSPAFPPHNIRVGRIYLLGQDSDGYILSDAKRKIRMNLEEIKMLFTPVGKTWGEVLDKPKTDKKKD